MENLVLITVACIGGLLWASYDDVKTGKNLGFDFFESRVANSLVLAFVRAFVAGVAIMFATLPIGVVVVALRVFGIL